MAMYWFFKMNKTSFYHHYFKVIEEVEFRNSQEIPATVSKGLGWLSTVFTSILSWIASQFTVVVSFIFLLPLTLLTVYAGELPFHWHRHFAVSLYPTRAP